jgi:alpha-tubulin suppressor-like RCC1 family protein
MDSINRSQESDDSEIGNESLEMIDVRLGTIDTIRRRVKAAANVLGSMAMVAVLAGCTRAEAVPKTKGETVSAGKKNLTITVGDAHACASVNGDVKCWGHNHYGELGNNHITDSHVLVQVEGLTSGVTAIDAGGAYHACAVVNGGAQCWGGNAEGQLGNNSTIDSHVPVQVEGLTSGVKAIVVGSKHTCALVKGGVQCWGSNNSGELGNNSMTRSFVPVQVHGLTSGVTAIAAGSAHNCAVVRGEMKCWGYNGEGQLGNDSRVRSLVPMQVNGLTSDVTAIAAGSYHSCAVVNGGAQCWGENLYGALGNNSTTNSRVPVQVQGLISGVTAIAAGGPNTCAVVNGGVQCWGDNHFGQLGNDSTDLNSLVPVKVRFP